MRNRSPAWRDGGCRGNNRAAFPYKIFLFASAEIGSARKPSIPARMSFIPNPGQSVPNSTLSAISSIRGKYSSNRRAGMLEMSM